jgi:hypothetical protein
MTSMLSTVRHADQRDGEHQKTASCGCRVSVDTCILSLLLSHRDSSRTLFDLSSSVVGNFA